MTATVRAVHLSAVHSFGKRPAAVIELVDGIGVRGDAHAGVTVQHRSRMAVDPSQPNLRQVHLLHGELFTELERVGYQVAPGDLGENITTTGIDLLGLPVGARLGIGAAIVAITGLRNPCRQINDFRPGLLNHLLRTDGAGAVERLAGVMGVVVQGATVRPGDRIAVELPAPPHVPLSRV